MDLEIKALEDNGTWSYTALPPGKKLIDCKWVYQIKYNTNRSIEQYKARLVAKRYMQIKDLDYKETFAPVVKLTTIRCLLSGGGYLWLLSAFNGHAKCLFAWRFTRKSLYVASTKI